MSTVVEMALAEVIIALNEPPAAVYMCVSPIDEKQITIHPRKGCYFNVLNDRGFKLYNSIIDRVSSGNCAGTIRKAQFCPSKSSNRYESSNNRVVQGMLYRDAESEGIAIQTSVVILYTESWCYTLSKSIYILERDEETASEEETTTEEYF